MDQEIKTYQLKRPVTVGEYTCTEVKLCRPKTKDFVAVGSQPLDTTEAIVLLLSSISGIPEVVISRFDIDDISILRIEAIRIVDAYFSAEIPALLPDMGYETVMDFYREELLFRHKKAVSSAKRLRGVT
jgi:hypothetical protein